MTELIRLIVSELAKEPFKKSFTIISFDTLSPQALLQVLHDVFTEIDPNTSPKGLDIREEDAETTVIRSLNMLRIVKYKPTQDEDPSVLRTGLLNGSSKVVHPILAWILPRLNELQVRAYLAKFLIRIEIPPDIRGDSDVEELFSQYEDRIASFTSIHKTFEDMKKKGLTTTEIRKDIAAMEQEQESVSRKIEKLKRGVETHTSSMASTSQPQALISGLLDSVQNFRKEKEKSRELSQQHIGQNTLLNQAEQRIQRLGRQIKEVIAANNGATAEGILQRLQADVDVAKYIVGEKLPGEMALRRKELSVYERVLGDTALNPKDLEELTQNIQEVKKDVNDLVMRKMMKNEDNNLVMFRQQAAIVQNKKSGLVEKLNESRVLFQGLKEEEEDRKGKLASLQGDTVVKEDDFKDYVKSLRVKSTRYKQMKGELSYLKNEGGVLSKTIFVLEEQLKDSGVDIAAMESKLGIKGFTSIQDNLEKVSSEKAKVDEKKSQDLQEMSNTAQELHDQIAAKKVDLAPLVKNLNALRQQTGILGHEHETAKRRYDNVSSSVDNSLSSITREVETLRKRYQEDQLRYCRVVSEITVLKVNLARDQDELKNYTAGGGGSTTSGKSYKEQLMAKIQEEERTAKNLKGEEKEIATRQGERVQQALMWKDIVKLLNLKKQIKENQQGIK